MSRLDELNLELQTLNTQLEGLVASGRDVVNDIQAEADLDYLINQINKITTEISCLIN